MSPTANRCVIFIHIPKTAGVTLGTAFRFQYPKGIVSFETLDKPIEEFESVPIADRKDAKVVMGHVHYGLHRYIPQECVYVTFLRDPVARVLSLYKFILRVPQHPLHARVSETMGLHEFIASGIDKTQTENGQTRQICGLQDGDPDRAALDAAKRNLETFAAVGLMESFDESLMLFRRALGWRMPPFYLSRNVSPGSAPNVVVSDEALELIRERNVLDLELYDFGRRLFADGIREQGPSFPRRLRTFKTLNKIPDAFGGGVGRLARRIVRSRLAARLRGESEPIVKR